MNWINVKDKLPEPGKEVEIKFEDGQKLNAYLCKCCKREFRCALTGLGWIEQPKYWRYLK